MNIPYPKTPEQIALVKLGAVIAIQGFARHSLNKRKREFLNAHTASQAPKTKSLKESKVKDNVYVIHSL